MDEIILSHVWDFATITIFNSWPPHYYTLYEQFYDKQNIKISIMYKPNIFKESYLKIF
nr:MAG TPA: hypothetical protein [Caudoviricetes sp.]